MPTIRAQPMLAVLSFVGPFNQVPIPIRYKSEPMICPSAPICTHCASSDTVSMKKPINELSKKFHFELTPKEFMFTDY